VQSSGNPYFRFINVMYSPISLLMESRPIILDHIWGRYYIPVLRYNIFRLERGCIP
jgi:hypothetical protein